MRVVLLILLFGSFAIADIDDYIGAGEVIAGAGVEYYKNLNTDTFNALIFGVLFTLCFLVTFIFGLTTSYFKISEAKESTSTRNLMGYVVMPVMYLLVGLIVYILFSKVLGLTSFNPTESLHNFFVFGLDTIANLEDKKNLNYLKFTLTFIDLLSDIVMYICALMPFILFVFLSLLSFVLQENISRQMINSSKITIWVLQIIGLSLVTYVFIVLWGNILDATMFKMPIETAKYGTLSDYNDMSKSIIKYYVRSGLGLSN